MELALLMWALTASALACYYAGTRSLDRMDWARRERILRYAARSRGDV